MFPAFAFAAILHFALLGWQVGGLVCLFSSGYTDVNDGPGHTTSIRWEHAMVNEFPLRRIARRDAGKNPTVPSELQTTTPAFLEWVPQRGSTPITNLSGQ